MYYFVHLKINTSFSDPVSNYSDSFCIFMTVPSTRKLADQSGKESSFSSSRPKIITLVLFIML